MMLVVLVAYLGCGSWYSKKGNRVASEAQLCGTFQGWKQVVILALLQNTAQEKKERHRAETIP